MDDNFDQDHPLYLEIKGLADLTKAHPALRDGAQQHRFGSAEPGVYAFSRLDREQGREYVVALNNAETAKTATIPTYMASSRFDRLFGEGPDQLTTDADRGLQVTVPALSTVVYKAADKIPVSGEAPSVAVTNPAHNGEGRQRMEVVADIGGDSFYEVTFYAKAAGGAWEPIGTDDNAPYRAFHDIWDLEPGTQLQYKAVVLDNAGHARESAVRTGRVAKPTVSLSVRSGTPTELRVTTVPEQSHYVVTVQRKVDDGPWTPIGTDDTSPVYTVFDDQAGVPAGASVSYRAILDYGSGEAIEPGAGTAHDRDRPLQPHGRRLPRLGPAPVGRRDRARGRDPMGDTAPARRDRRLRRAVPDPGPGHVEAGELHRPPAGRRHRADDARAGRRPVVHPGHQQRDLAQAGRHDDLHERAAAAVRIDLGLVESAHRRMDAEPARADAPGMIEVDNLSKRYGAQLAVDGVSFRCEPGTITGFLGPNGAGKSTTLRMICGLTPPTTGSSTVLGTSYRNLPNPGRRVGVLLDASAQHSGRTGREVLRLTADVLGADPSRVPELLDRVGLPASAARKRVGNYSLGMRQRLGIAQALIGEPEVLILDEPANGLDPEGIFWMRGLLRDFADRAGTVLLSSHLLREVEAVADELIVIGEGKIVAQGTKAELLATTGTLVRAADPEALSDALMAAELEVEPAIDGSLVVEAPPEVVGRVAAEAGLALVELRPADGGGLEQLFLTLTRREEVAA